MSDVYRRLAERLDSLPNGFPATENGLELKILRKIFSPEEADMALKMRTTPETAEAISERLCIPLDEMQAILDNMVKKGQIGSGKIKGRQVYMLFPFCFGIYEFQLPRLDKEFALLMEEYIPTLVGTLGRHAPAVMRVIPLNVQIDAEQAVYPYEDIYQVIQESKSIQVMDCMCRKKHALIGRQCEHSLEVCLALANSEGAFDKYPKGRSVTREEAIEIIKKADEEGLVHSTFNVQNGLLAVCNCCSCACLMLGGMMRHNAPHLMAKSNYVAAIEQGTCDACGVCANDRCPVGAIVELEGSYVVDATRCLGCGICRPTCPTESITLVRKPQKERDQPPKNILDWYTRRAERRGVKMTIR
ncbi:MAG: 4Fe-4S binding protein [Desulfomonilaceae bacterium]|nr:4Fe-4S binding protein [Desulfomonilaceae bacterium]